MDYSIFIPQFGNFILTALAFVFCLSVIVFVHEFTLLHRKVSGIHAEVFSIGFGPVLVAFCDKNGTKWQMQSCHLVAL